MSRNTLKADMKPETPYEAGKLALSEGRDFTNNPYQEGSPEHRAWYCGWRDVEEKR